MKIKTNKWVVSTNGLFLISYDRRTGDTVYSEDSSDAKKFTKEKAEEMKVRLRAGWILEVK